MEIKKLWCTKYLHFSDKMKYFCSFQKSKQMPKKPWNPEITRKTINDVAFLHMLLWWHCMCTISLVSEMYLECAKPRKSLKPNPNFLGFSISCQCTTQAQPRCINFWAGLTKILTSLWSTYERPKIWVGTLLLTSARTVSWNREYSNSRTAF